jgi:hypothetical protein
VPWLLSITTKIRDLPRRLAVRSTASAAVELAGAAWFIWGLHEAWAPLAGLIGGPLAVLVGIAVDTPTGGDSG